MKITGAKFFPVATPRETGLVSLHLLIRIDTDEGLSGWGERSDFGQAPMAELPGYVYKEEEASQRIAGADPLNIYGVLDRLDGLLTPTFEIGLHDLVGKILGVPVYTLLGGKRRDRVPVCYPIFGVNSEIIEVNIERVQRVVDMGFTRIRKYVSPNLDAEEQFLRQLRDTFGWDLEITALDLSGRFEWQESLDLLERFAPYQYELAESVGKTRADLEGMAQVRRRLDAPISEHLGSCRQIAEFHQAEAVDICNCSTHGKGVRRSKAILDFALEMGMGVLHGTTQELSLGTAAAAHVCASLANLEYTSYPVGPVLYTEDCTQDRIRYEDSCLVVPDSPGLGIEIDEEQLERLRYTPA